MRFSTVAFTLFGAAASASASALLARQSLPDCAVACTTSADLGGCQPTDTRCLCTNQAFVSSTTDCITAACTGDDLQTALGFSQGLCLSVGVTLSAPSPTSDASTTSDSSTATSPAATSETSTATSSSAAAAGATTAPPSPDPSTAAASTHGVNAIVGLAVAGFLALAL